jgi:hypothetical protein
MKKQTAVEWLVSQVEDYFCLLPIDIIEKAKEMEKEQMGYTKEDVLMAGFIGEINHFDTKHIVSLLDEAKQYNKTHGDK